MYALFHRFLKLRRSGRFNERLLVLLYPLPNRATIVAVKSTNTIRNASKPTPVRTSGLGVINNTHKLASALTFSKMPTVHPSSCTTRKTLASRREQPGRSCRPVQTKIHRSSVEFWRVKMVVSVCRCTLAQNTTPTVFPISFKYAGFDRFLYEPSNTCHRMHAEQKENWVRS